MFGHLLLKHVTCVCIRVHINVNPSHFIIKMNQFKINQNKCVLGVVKVLLIRLNFYATRYMRGQNLKLIKHFFTISLNFCRCFISGAVNSKSILCDD